MRPSLNLDLTPEPDIDSSRSRAARLVIFVLAGLAAAPVCYELAALSAARWAALTGPIQTVETPILDAIGRALGECWHFGATVVHDRLHDLPWQPTILMGLGVCWLTFGWWILRRS